MRRPSGQFAVVVLFVVKAVGINTLAGWHARSRLRRCPRRSAVLDNFVAVIQVVNVVGLHVVDIFDVVEIDGGSGLGGPFLGLTAATTATTAASAASTALLLGLTCLGLAARTRSGRSFAGCFGFGYVVELGIELALQIGTGTGFVELKLIIR